MDDEFDSYPGLWYFIVGNPVPAQTGVHKDTKGSMEGWNIMINIANATEQRQLEVKSKESVDMLFANMSHELKTPLNGIIALSEVLCADLEEDGVDAEDDTFRSLNVIRTSGLRLNNLVTNLLDASLLKKKKLNIRAEDDIDLHKLAQDIANLNQRA